MITVIAIIVGSVCLGILFVSFFVVNVVQTQLIKSTDNNIKASSKKLQAVPDVNKILTVQNQLGQLTTLHENKHVTSRVFEYLSKLTPTNATLNLLTLDHTANTITLGGKADSLDTVRIFADTLKQTEFQTPGSTQAPKAFSEVVLSSFSTGKDDTQFTIMFKFNPEIFNSSQVGSELIVPANAGSTKDNVFTEKQ